METKPDSATGLVSGDDALRDLCFSDAVFRQRYEGWRVLGRGPWATVIRTRSLDLGQDVALKVFVNLDPELLERVRHEVRAVQVLATPYLVHTYSLFDRETIAWFEMEVVDGSNLQQELDRLAALGERLPLVRAYEIALAVSRCVWHAHRQGVLHRDIKPANVLLPLSGRPAAKVSDFGIARLADTASTTPHLRVGSPVRRALHRPRRLPARLSVRRTMSTALARLSTPSSPEVTHPTKSPRGYRSPHSDASRSRPHRHRCARSLPKWTRALMAS